MDLQAYLLTTYELYLVAAVSLLAWIITKHRRSSGVFLSALCLVTALGTVSAKAGDSTHPEVYAPTNTEPHFNVITYAVHDNAMLPTNDWTPTLSKYTGTNVSLSEIVKAASGLQAEYRNRGYPGTSVAIAQEQIADGIVTFNVFQSAIPQIVVSGVRYNSSTNATTGLVTIAPVLVPQNTAASASTATNVPPPFVLSPTVPVAARPATPKQIEDARDLLFKEMASQDVEEKDTRIHVVTTNTGPRFDVEHYVISGNSILTPQTIAATLTNIDGDFGTNVSFEGIKTVVQQLQLDYRDRGYLTIAVGLPPQKLTNATIKVHVTEGVLVAIDVEGNRYFSSNNVMRALPSLHTNILLNGNVLQAELNRANANQDRKIYPVLSPGPEPGTSALTLHVKDQLPLHAKADLDNFNSPGTPDLRINASAVYNNLWQQEHSVGVQYSFSPQHYKQGDEWDFYDRPDVVNYSAFYRLPLGGPSSLENEIMAKPGTFGFSEATRKFNLPPAGSVPSLTLFASRSAIDTGTAETSDELITLPGENPSITHQAFEHSPTINEDVAGRLDYPLATSGNLQSTFSGGLDVKTFLTQNFKTNFFTILQTNFDTEGNPILPPVKSEIPSIVPITEDHIVYIPLSIHYNGSWQDSLGTSTVGLGLGANLWYSATFATTAFTTNGPVTTTLTGSRALKAITGSPQSTGYWVVLNPSYSRNIVINDWTTLVRLNGQWASEPLISPEQFGAGGVNSVRGYPEGDVFGDDGWNFSLEEQTPVHTVGMIGHGTPLTIFGSIYMDYAAVYLIGTPGHAQGQDLWGTGVGLTAAAGPHWQARFLFSFPLRSTPDTPAYEPRFNFSLTAQF